MNEIDPVLFCSAAHLPHAPIQAPHRFESASAPKAPERAAMHDAGSRAAHFDRERTRPGQRNDRLDTRAAHSFHEVDERPFGPSLLADVAYVEHAELAFRACTDGSFRR